MSDSYTNLLYHIVFSTKDRRPVLASECQARLYDYLGGTVRKFGGIALAVNGTKDHIHLLAKLPPNRALSDVLRDLKANSSGWVQEVFPSLKSFSWQRGYAAFTVSQFNIESAQKYVAGQKQHHQTKTFREEFLQFLRANGIAFDEQFI
jgi:putative transposase